MYTLHVFRAGEGQRSATLEELPELLQDPALTIWLDLEDPSADEAKVLGEVFHFHPLAIEDTLHDYGHPKLDVYDDHIFLIVHGIDFTSADRLQELSFGTIELDLFFGPRMVVSHHPPGMRSVAGLHADVCAPSTRPWTAVRLFHRLVDRLIDNFIPTIDQVGESLEILEDRTIADPRPALLDQILTAKKTILRLRRIINHQRSILESLSRGHLAVVAADQVAFFRDIYDHFVYVADQIESYREQVQSIMDAYHSVSSNRMNEIMKVLTQISTVMLPLTFIAGVYGMNFDRMPELHWTLGYPFAISLMLITAAGMVAYFRSRRLL